MRVLFLATGIFSTGGIERYARYHIRALRELLGRENVFVFSLLGPESADPGGSFEVDYAGGRLAWSTKVRFFARSMGFAARNNIDVIFCNHVQLTPIGLVARRLFGIPYWMMGHGLEMWSPLKPRERLGMRLASAHQTGCEFTRQYMIRHHGIPPERIRVINDCVDVETFRPITPRDEIFRRYELPDPSEEHRVLLTISRLGPGAQHKGHYRILQAMQRLDMPHLVYVIAGQGEYRQTLQEAARDLGLADRIFFPGFVDDGDLVDLYNLCDAFILVSEFGERMGEGLPLVLLEASACGKPIIAGNADGSPEAVDDGVNGIVVAPHDIDGIARAIESVLMDPEVTKHMGAEGRRRVLEKTSYDVFKAHVHEFLAILPEAR